MTSYIHRLQGYAWYGGCKGKLNCSLEAHNIKARLSLSVMVKQQVVKEKLSNMKTDSKKKTLTGSKLFHSI